MNQKPEDHIELTTKQALMKWSSTSSDLYYTNNCGLEAVKQNDFVDRYSLTRDDDTFDDDLLGSGISRTTSIRFNEDSFEVKIDFTKKDVVCFTTSAVTFYNNYSLEELQQLAISVFN